MLAHLSYLPGIVVLLFTTARYVCETYILNISHNKLTSVLMREMYISPRKKQPLFKDLLIVRLGAGETAENRVWNRLARNLTKGYGNRSRICLSVCL